LGRWINEKREDKIDEFVNYYIVFNFLYERYSDDYYTEFERYVKRRTDLNNYWARDKDGNGITYKKGDKVFKVYNFPEWRRYKFFLWFLKDQLGGLGFDPCSKLCLESELVKDPVKNLGKGRYQPNVIDLKDDGMKLVYDIFDNIYAIRCNLFHGDKVVQHRSRDLKLIEEASAILKDLLNAYMVFQFGEHWQDLM